jgi:hypothetical protein
MTSSLEGGVEYIFNPEDIGWESVLDQFIRKLKYFFTSKDYGEAVDDILKEILLNFWCEYITSDIPKYNGGPVQSDTDHEASLNQKSKTSILEKVI